MQVDKFEAKMEEQAQDQSEHQESSLENEVDAFIKLSGLNIHQLRMLKTEIEPLIISKLASLEDLDKAAAPKESSVIYFSKYSVDKVGLKVQRGETGVAEGWNVPLYQNEFQSMVGLPNSEDQTTLRIRRPRQECFNCLSTSHLVTDCPVRMNRERCDLHRQNYAQQAQQASEQSQLFSNRYTSDDLNEQYFKAYGMKRSNMMPGKCSKQLREALGIMENQLPPYIYKMRDLGYPIGWLIEAQVKEVKLSVMDGELQPTSEEAAEGGDATAVEYDPDKIISFPGFNDPIPEGMIDEYRSFGVRRYDPERFSKEKFMSTLNLKKRKVVVRRTMSKTKVAEDSEGENEGSDDGELEESDKDMEDEEEAGSKSPTTPNVSKKRKRKTENEDLGNVSMQIPGTPVVHNMSGVERVPNWENFSKDICDHKPFEMDPSVNAIGNFQNIIEMTRKFKQAQQTVSESGSLNSSLSQ